MIQFENPNVCDCDYLTDLAMDSNASYNYRTVSDCVAREVLMMKREYFDKGAVMVMKSDDQIIGFFSLSPLNFKDELTHLFLRPSFIGKGFGRILFQKAMQVAKETLLWQSLQWESDPFAAGFYQSMGAVLIGSNPCRLNLNYRSPVFSYLLRF